MNLRAHRLRPVFLLLCLLAIAGCRAPSPSERYERWLAEGQRGAVERYRAYLHAQGVAEIVPMQQLLRSGRRWRLCRAAEFALPPQAAWADTARTLRLIDELHSAGLIGGAEIASGYREPALNRCEGGSPRSQHLHGGAYDFDLASDADIAALCGFWRRRGPASGFGLGFYDRRRLHIDTAGFRTWGSNYRRSTSLCVARLSDSAQAVARL